MGSYMSNGKKYEKGEIDHELESSKKKLLKRKQQFSLMLQQNEKKVEEMIKTHKKINQEIYNSTGKKNVILVRNIVLINKALLAIEILQKNSLVLTMAQNNPDKASTLSQSLNIILVLIDKIGLGELRSLEEMVTNVMGHGYVTLAKQGKSVPPTLYNVLRNVDPSHEEISKYWAMFINRLKEKSASYQHNTDIVRGKRNETKYGSTPNVSSPHHFLTPQVKQKYFSKKDDGSNIQGSQGQAPHQNNYLNKGPGGIPSGNFAYPHQRGIDNQGAFLTPQPPKQTSILERGNSGDSRLGGSKLGSDMFKFNEPKRIDTYFKKDIPPPNSFGSNLGAEPHKDTTLPLKSKGLSIIFDPDAEVEAKKIQSILFGQSTIPEDQEVMESMITGVFNGNEIVPISNSSYMGGGTQNSFAEGASGGGQATLEKDQSHIEFGNNPYTNNANPYTAAAQDDQMMNDEGTAKNPYMSRDMFNQSLNELMNTPELGEVNDYGVSGKTFIPEPEDSFMGLMNGKRGATNLSGASRSNFGQAKQTEASKMPRRFSNQDFLPGQEKKKYSGRVVELEHEDLVHEIMNSCYKPGKFDLDGVYPIDRTPFDETIQDVKLDSFAKSRPLGDDELPNNALVKCLLDDDFSSPTTEFAKKVTPSVNNEYLSRVEDQDVGIFYKNRFKFDENEFLENSANHRKMA